MNREFKLQPYDTNAWRELLAPFTQPQTLNKLCEQLENGFDLGLDPNNLPNERLFCPNPPTTQAVHVGLCKTIFKWWSRNQLLGPFTQQEAQKMRLCVNPIFGVPKPCGAIRPVINNSFPKRQFHKSVNGHLRKELCTIKYTDLYSIVATARACGRNCWGWARDIQDGYFACYARKEQRRFLAFQFADRWWVPTVMTFGLSSAPHIFTKTMQGPIKAMCDALPNISYARAPNTPNNQILRKNEPNARIDSDQIIYPLIRSYIDDIMGFSPNKQDAFAQFHNCMNTLVKIGLKAKKAKDKIPSQLIEMLGALLDLKRQIITLPKDKYIRYIANIDAIMAMKEVSKLQLLSICGQSRFGASFMPPLRALIRGLEVHAVQLQRLTATLQVTNQIKEELNLIKWGLKYATNQGISFDFFLKRKEEPNIQILTDAAGVHGGIGGYTHTPKGAWFQMAWSDIPKFQAASIDIQWKELVAVLVAIYFNRRDLKGQKVQIWCDNLAVVWMIIKCRAKPSRPDLQSLLGKIAKLCISNSIHVWIDHIPGKDNIVADALSRFASNPFKSLPFDMAPKPLNCTDYVRKLAKQQASFKIKKTELVWTNNDNDANEFKAFTF